MDKLTLNIDSTSLSTSGCILRFIRTVCGDPLQPDAGAYRSPVNNVNLNLPRLLCGVQWLDVSEGWANPMGEIYAGLLQDGLHPTEKGYEFLNASGMYAAIKGALSVLNAARHRVLTEVEKIPF